MKKSKKLLAIFMLNMMLCTCALAVKYNCADTSGGYDKTKGTVNFSVWNYELDDSKSAQAACEFEKKFSQNSYQECLNDYNRALKLLKEGKCQKIISKKETIGTAVCEIRFDSNTNKANGYSCSGSDIDSAVAKIKQKYNL